MTATDLDEREILVIGECLKAAALGPFFPAPEFHSLFGLERGELLRIASEWPSLDRLEPRVRQAVTNTLNNLLGYPHGGDTEWSNYISASLKEVESIYKKWKDLDRAKGPMS